MSRIVIGLPDEDLRPLDAMKDIQEKNSAAVIRTTINSYFEESRASEAESAFGIWRMENGEGLAFQTALREEWPQ